MKNSRSLKIYRKYQTRKYRGTTIPQIRLEGKWLEKFGFKEGQMINIKPMKNKLIITIEKKNNPIKINI